MTVVQRHDALFRLVEHVCHQTPHDRARIPRLERRQCLVLAGRFDLVYRRLGGLTRTRLPRPQLVAPAIARDDVKPRRELRVRSEGVEAGVSLGEHLLGEIGGLRAVAGQPIAPGDDPRLMPAEQFFDERPRSLRSRRQSVLRNELLVRQNVHSLQCKTVGGPVRNDEFRKGFRNPKTRSGRSDCRREVFVRHQGVRFVRFPRAHHVCKTDIKVIARRARSAGRRSFGRASLSTVSGARPAR